MPRVTWAVIIRHIVPPVKKLKKRVSTHIAIVVYAYRDRRVKKREFRGLWIVRINAAARANGMTYSQFMNGLKRAGVALDRKVLAEMAYAGDANFAKLVETAKRFTAADAK